VGVLESPNGQCFHFLFFLQNRCVPRHVMVGFSTWELQRLQRDKSLFFFGLTISFSVVFLCGSLEFAER
jgi:hypothetical protein